MVGIVHCSIVGGSPSDIKNLSLALNKLKKSAGLDMEFLVTTDAVKLRDVKYLIDSLYSLYKNIKNEGKN